MQLYTNSLTTYSRLKTREVSIGGLLLGNGHPIRVQTMTTTDTMDTIATVEQTIRCIEAGAEMVRITAPSKKEAENLAAIKAELKRRGYDVPLIADIHFTPNAAEVAARVVEKVRINPGNYIDKKRFDVIDYTDAAYAAEIDRIRERFTPLVKICKEYGTAMRIGTNHGSLSDRIMSRYGDTPIGMVESAMEFLRIAREEHYHNIVLSMKSSNPQVMVQAYRLLVEKMMLEFNEAYPLHLGVTEAGDGEDGRIKSALGIGTLLEDGLGDTIRVSLTEDPELEIPVCKDIIKKYSSVQPPEFNIAAIGHLPYSPFNYQRRKTNTVDIIGGTQVPVVVADFTDAPLADPKELEAIGYHYDALTDKWSIGDMAADYILTGNKLPRFALPGTLKVIAEAAVWHESGDINTCLPLFSFNEYITATKKHPLINFINIDYNGAPSITQLDQLADDPTAVLFIAAEHTFAMAAIRSVVSEMMQKGVRVPVVIVSNSSASHSDDHLIQFSVETGALLLDGLGDGICLKVVHRQGGEDQGTADAKVSGRNYLETTSQAQFINNTAFSILQATRTRISKTEYISCPSCGRTLFDLQETTAKIRAVTNHLKGVKIAIMGCIVNGPGEMADADFGYVGSGPGKITLYKGKEVVKKNVPSAIAVEELINLLKENDAWVEVAEKSPAQL